MNALALLPETDPAFFLKTAGQGAGLQTHADLWRWLKSIFGKLDVTNRAQAVVKLTRVETYA